MVVNILTVALTLIVVATLWVVDFHGQEISKKIRLFVRNNTSRRT